MLRKFTFNQFDRQLLKLASKSAKAVAKGAKAANEKADLTEAASSAHAMEGYAEEAAHFISNPDGPNADQVELGFNHRCALRTGCWIRIRDIESMADDQEELIMDADAIQGTRRREEDFRRLEAILRSGDDPQPSLDIDKPAPSPDEPQGELLATAPEEEEVIDAGPFVGEAPAERLALMSPAPDDTAAFDEIPEAEFEMLGDDPEGAPRAPLSLVPDDVDDEAPLDVVDAEILEDEESDLEAHDNERE